MPNQPKTSIFHLIRIYLLIIVIAFTAVFFPVYAQWRVLDIKATINMRAVYTVSSNVCWIGGSRGTVLRTLNSGKSWTTLKIPDGDSLDFRDIHGFDKNTAIAMSAGEAQNGKAKIYRTENGGETWVLVYQTTQNGAFLDGIDFWDKNKGICLGDPIDGRLFIVTTEDNGKTWQELPFENRPITLPGETCFAASGTSILATGKGNVFIGTGGAKKARVFRSEDFGRSWEVSETPLNAGKTSGIFGLRFTSKKNGIAVGGDYVKTTDSTLNVLITNDSGVTWKLQGMTKPAGLKECVAVYHKTNATWNGDTQIRADNDVLVAVGPSGSSASVDRGKTWRSIGKEPFHSVSFAGNIGFAVGGKGLIGKIDKIAIGKNRKHLKMVDE